MIASICTLTAAFWNWSTAIVPLLPRRRKNPIRLRRRRGSPRTVSKLARPAESLPQQDTVSAERARQEVNLIRSNRFAAVVCAIILSAFSLIRSFITGFPARSAVLRSVASW